MVRLPSLTSRPVVKATFRGHRGDHVLCAQVLARRRETASSGRRIGGLSIVRGLKRLIGVPVGVGPEEDADVTVLDVASGTRVGVVESAIHPFFSPDGRTLAVPIGRSRSSCSMSRRPAGSGPRR